MQDFIENVKSLSVNEFMWFIKIFWNKILLILTTNSQNHTVPAYWLRVYDGKIDRVFIKA